MVIAARRPELGWRLWGRAEWSYPVTTLPAVQAAKAPAVGGLLVSDELDTALRRELYVEGECISIHSVILGIAECVHVDAEALGAALARGSGRAEVYEQWRTARGPEIQGRPHLFAPGGYAVHNPSVIFE